MKKDTSELKHHEINFMNSKKEITEIFMATSQHLTNYSVTMIERDSERSDLW